MKSSEYASWTLDLEVPLTSLEIGLAFLLSSICPRSVLSEAWHL